MEQQLLSPLKAEVPSVPENDEWQVTTMENGDVFPVVHEGSLTLAPIQLSTPQVPPFNNNDAMKNPMELLQQMVEAEVARRSAVETGETPSANDGDGYQFRPIAMQPPSTVHVNLHEPKPVSACRPIAPKPSGDQPSQPFGVRVMFRSPAPVYPTPTVGTTENLDLLAHTATSRRNQSFILSLPATGTTGYPTDQRIRQWLGEIGVVLSAKHEAYSYARLLVKRFVQQIFTAAKREAESRAGGRRAMVDIAHIQAVTHRRNNGTNSQPR